MLSLLNRNTFYTRCVIGLLQGLVLYVLNYLCQNKIVSPHAQTYFLVPLFVISCFVPLLILQSIKILQTKLLMIWSTVVTILLAALTVYAAYRQYMPQPSDAAYLWPSAVFIFATMIALFISHSLILSSSHDNRFIANYHTYFDTSWKLGLQLFFTIAFVSAFWLLLTLGSALFQLIHLSFFSIFIYKLWFAFPATTVAIAVALEVTDINVRIIDGTRTLILTLLSWLLPIISMIIGLFLISLLVTGISALWGTQHACTLLLLSITLLILLINANYQDGTRITTLSTLQYYATIISASLLTPIILLTIYALYLRVHQYGWTTERIYAATCIFILATYAFGYTAAAMFTRKHLQFIERSNITAAFLILAGYLFLFTPIGDPARLSVNNQVSRLTTGKVKPDKFDFAWLHFDGERFGHEALLSLQKTDHGSNTIYIHNAVKNALTLTNRYDQKSNVIAVTAHTQNHKLPDSFMNQNWRQSPTPLPACLYSSYMHCDAWIIPSQDNQPVVLLLDWNGFTGFKQTREGLWKIIGNWPVPSNCYYQVKRAAEKSPLTFAPPLPGTTALEVAGFHLGYSKPGSCDEGR